MNIFLGQLRASKCYAFGTVPKRIVNHDDTAYASPSLLIPPAQAVVAEACPHYSLS